MTNTVSGQALNFSLDALTKAVDAIKADRPHGNRPWIFFGVILAITCAIVLTDVVEHWLFGR